MTSLDTGNSLNIPQKGDTEKLFFKIIKHISSEDDNEGYIENQDWYAGNYRNLTFSEEDFKEDSAPALDFLGRLCVTFIERGENEKIIEDILTHSIQNGCDDGIDLNANFSKNKENGYPMHIFKSVIKYGNYELFKKLIDLKVSFLQFSDLLVEISQITLLRKVKDGEKEGKIKILQTLLDLGLKVKKKHVLSLISSQKDIDFLEVIYQNDLKQPLEERIFNLNFVENLLKDDDNCKESFRMPRYYISNEGLLLNFFTILQYKLHVASKLVDGGKLDQQKVNDVTQAEVQEAVVTSMSPEVQADIVSGVVKDLSPDLTDKAVKLLIENIKPLVEARSSEIVRALFKE